MKPMLFNTEMVKAIIEGRKTVTRRVLKLPFEIHPNGFITKPKGNERLCPYEPPFQTNDILYVRETWRVGAWDIKNQMIAFDYKDGSCGELVFIHDRELFNRLVNNSREDARRAGCEYNGIDFIWKKGASPCKWHPSIHMPKEAARIFLRVKDVRVERLKDIDDKGAYLEGAGELNVIYQIGARVCEFAKIWNSTIKPADINTYGWDANPWVWVIEFERITKEQAYELESKKA